MTGADEAGGGIVPASSPVRWGVGVLAFALALVCVLVAVVAIAVASRSGSVTDSTHAEAINVGRYAGPPLSLTPPPTTDVAMKTRREEASADATDGWAVKPGTEAETDPATARDCLYSHDPACGDFYWDPAVQYQRPDLSFTISPEDPVVGELVTFTFTWSHPTADAPFMDFKTCGPDEICVGPAVKTQCLPFGRWVPPAPRPGSGTLVFTARFTQPGIHQWSADLTVSLSTYPSFAAEHGDCVPADPYASQTGFTETILVRAA